MQRKQKGQKRNKGFNPDGNGAGDVLDIMNSQEFKSSLGNGHENNNGSNGDVENIKSDISAELGDLNKKFQEQRAENGEQNKKSEVSPEVEENKEVVESSVEKEENPVEVAEDVKGKIDKEVETVEDEIKPQAEALADDAKAKVEAVIIAKPNRVYSSRAVNNYDADGQPMFKKGDKVFDSKYSLNNVKSEASKRFDEAETQEQQELEKQKNELINKYQKTVETYFSEQGVDISDDAYQTALEKYKNDFVINILEPIFDSGDEISSDKLKVLEHKADAQGKADAITVIASVEPSGVAVVEKLEEQKVETEAQKPEEQAKVEKKKVETQDVASEENPKENANLELLNVELKTEDIEKVFTDPENADIINDLKALLAGKEGGGTEVLESGIRTVLDSYFAKILLPEQLAAIQDKISTLASETANQLVGSYNQYLDTKAKEKSSVYKKMITGLRGNWKKMALTVAAGVGAGALAAVIAPTLGIATGAAAFVGRFAVKGAVRSFFKKTRGRKLNQGEDNGLSEKEQAEFNQARAEVMEQSIDAQSLAVSVNNIIRVETSKFSQEKLDLVNEDNKVDPEVVEVLFDNIHDTVFKNTIKRAEIENNLREQYTQRQQDFDSLSDEEKSKVLKDALDKEVNFLFMKYSSDLITQANLSDYQAAGPNSNFGKNLSKFQSALSGNFSAVFDKSNSNGAIARDTIAAGLAGGVTYYAYEHSSGFAGVTTGLASAGMAYEYGTRAENRAMADTYMQEMRDALDQAEENITKAEKGNGDRSVVDRLANKIQALKNLKRPSADGQPSLAFIDDPALQSRADNFLNKYYRSQVERGSIEGEKISNLSNIIEGLQDKIKQDQKEAVKAVDEKMKKVMRSKRTQKRVAVAVAGVAGYLLGSEIRENFAGSHDQAEANTETSASAGESNDEVGGAQRNVDESEVGSIDRKVDNYEPIIEKSVWNTIEENLKNHPKYQEILKYAIEKGGGKFDPNMSSADLAKLDLDKFALGTTAIDKLKDDLVESLAKGDNKFIDSSLTPEQLKAIGFDNLKNINPNNLTAEQMKAIDWDKLMVGDGADGKPSQIEEVMKAMKLNEDPETMKKILEHSKALADLAKDGKVDWSGDFDKAASADNIIDNAQVELTKAAEEVVADVKSDVKGEIVNTAGEAGKNDFMVDTNDLVDKPITGDGVEENNTIEETSSEISNEINKTSNDIFKEIDDTSEKVSEEINQAQSELVPNKVDMEDSLKEFSMRLSPQDQLNVQKISKDFYDRWNGGEFSTKGSFLDAVKDKMGHLDTIEQERWSNVWEKNHEIIENGPVNQNIMVKNVLELYFSREIAEDIAEKAGEVAGEDVVSEVVEQAQDSLPAEILENKDLINNTLHKVFDSALNNETNLQALDDSIDADREVIVDILQSIDKVDDIVGGMDKFDKNQKFLLNLIVNSIPDSSLDQIEGLKELRDMAEKGLL